MINRSDEAMIRLLAEYIEAFEKCANAPDETYETALIAMQPIREHVRQFFTAKEFEAIIFNLEEIKEIVQNALRQEDV